jgi:hypothetical protein
MRGRIIQYNGVDGSGVIMAQGRQYRFTIAVWKAESVPAAGKTVEIVTEDDAVTGVTLVPDDVLLKEKAAELGGKLSSALGNIDLSSLKGSGGAAAIGTGAVSANSIVQRYGKVMLGAYVLFLIGSLVLTAVSVGIMGNSMGKSLFEVASLLSQMGANGGGGIKLMLVLAYIGVALPIVWQDKRAWLALLLPLIATLWSTVAIMRIANSMSGGMMGDMSDLFSIDFGFYLTGLSALVLAGGGAVRFLRGA